MTATLGTFRCNLGIARTMTLASLGLSQFVHLFDCRKEKGSSQKGFSIGNRYQLAAGLAGFGLILGCIYIPGLTGLFQTVSLGLTHWLVVLAGTAAAVGADRVFAG